MRKLLLLFLIVIFIFAVSGRLVNVKADVDNETTLAIYIYSDGGNTHLTCRLYAPAGNLIFNGDIAAGKIKIIPAVPGGHVEISLFPDNDYYLASFSAKEGVLTPDPFTSESCRMNIIEGKNSIGFVLFPIPKKTAVFDIRSMRGEGSLVFKTEQQEKSFGKKDFYPGYIPAFEDLKNITAPAPIYRNQLPTIANPEYRSSISHSSLLYRYQVENKVYLTGRSHVTMTVLNDAYVTINGKGKMFAKGEMVSFTIGFDYQSWKISVYFFDDTHFSGS